MLAVQEDHVVLGVTRVRRSEGGMFYILECFPSRAFWAEEWQGPQLDPGQEAYVEVCMPRIR